jgi:hypothetical protein
VLKVIGKFLHSRFFSRIFFAIVAGCAAGILGVVGFMGLYFYFSFEVLFLAAFMLMVGAEHQRFFTSWASLAFGSAFQSFMVQKRPLSLYIHSMLLY